MNELRMGKVENSNSDIIKRSQLNKYILAVIHLITNELLLKESGFILKAANRCN